MANRFIGLNRGGDINTVVTEGSSTGSTDVELRIDDTKGLTKQGVIKLLRSIEKHLLETNTTVPDA